MTCFLLLPRLSPLLKVLLTFLAAVPLLDDLLFVFDAFDFLSTDMVLLLCFDEADLFLLILLLVAGMAGFGILLLSKFPVEILLAEETLDREFSETLLLSIVLFKVLFKGIIVFFLLFLITLMLVIVLLRRALLLPRRERLCELPLSDCLLLLSLFALLERDREEGTPPVKRALLEKFSALTF